MALPGGYSGACGGDDGGARLFRRLISEGFNQGRLAVVDEVVAADFVEHQFEAQPLPRDARH